MRIPAPAGVGSPPRVTGPPAPPTRAGRLLYTFSLLQVYGAERNDGRPFGILSPVARYNVVAKMIVKNTFQTAGGK